MDQPPHSAIAAIAARFGLPVAAMRPVSGQGEANHTYFLGDDLVVRIAQEHFAADLRKEAQVIPYVRRTGVRTPELRHFEDDGDSAPWMVSRRSPGKPLESLNFADRSAAYRSAGRALRRLHDRIDGDDADSLSLVPVDRGGETLARIERLASDGVLGTTEVAGALAWLDRLAEYSPAVRETRFIHGDAGPSNILLLPSGVDLIDWGDAAWADPALEFGAIPPDLLPAAVAGYVDDDAEDSREQWAARALWYHLTPALFRLAQAPTERDRWFSRRGNRMFALLRFFAQSPPEPWCRLGPR